MTTNWHVPLTGVDVLDTITLNSRFSDLDSAITGLDGQIVEDTVDPTASDDGYDLGTVWINTVRDRAWMCVDNTAADASWVLVGGEIYCEVYNSAAQAVADSTTTSVTFDTELSDDDAMFPGSGSAFTVPFDGLYIINAHVRWQSHSTGIRDLRITDGTITRYITFNAVSGNITRQNLVAIMDLSANDTVQVKVFQDSTVSLNLQNEATNAPDVSIALIHGYINRK